MRTANQQRFSGINHRFGNINQDTVAVPNEQIRTAVLSGLSYRKAAAILGCSYAHVAKIMKELGEPQTHRNYNRGGIFPCGRPRKITND